MIHFQFQCESSLCVCVLCVQREMEGLQKTQKELLEGSRRINEMMEEMEKREVCVFVCLFVCLCECVHVSVYVVGDLYTYSNTRV